MSFLIRQIHFTAAFKSKVFAGLIIGVFLSFIIIFLEPFDTNQFQAEYRLLLLAGFGFLLSVTFVLQSVLENTWYRRMNKSWLVKHEILATFLFFVLTGSVLYLYNRIIINQLDYSIESHWWYYSHIVVVMIPVIAPLFIYVRQKFGERIIAPSASSYAIIGENRNEELNLEKEAIVYVKSIENYVEIYFIDSSKKLISKTFRQTLSKVHEQLPFLERCHKSYLVNGSKIKAIEGNSQRSQITFNHTDKNIPISKTLYKNFKSRFTK